MFRVGVRVRWRVADAPQPHNNIVRVAYEALAAVLGGVQSMFTGAWDEPLQIPTEDPPRWRCARSRCSRTRRASRAADPLGGSYYVERSPTRWRERSPRSWTSSNAAAAWCRASRTATSSA